MRKRFTIEELAIYFGVHRNTMRKWLKDGNVDLRDVTSVLDFITVQNLRDNAQSEVIVAQMGVN